MTTCTVTPELLGMDDCTPLERRTALHACSSRGSKKGLLLDPRASRVRKMRTTVVTGARLLQDRLAAAGRNASWRPAMLTLTYARVADWSPNHVRDFLTVVRNWLQRRGHRFYYVWVAELQERGAVHYHIVIWLPRVGSKFLKLPKPDKEGWWKFGSSQVVWARRAVGYLVKYASKSDNPDIPFPKGLRLYALGGVLPSERVELRWWRSPLYVRQLLTFGADVHKIKGGYEDRVSGSVVVSPWRLSMFLSSRPFFVWDHPPYVVTNTKLF